MKKRFVSLTLAASLAAVSMAGCGSSDANATTAAPAADTTAAATEGSEAAADTTAAASGENTTLKWSVWDISLTTYYEPLIEAFEASHPGVTVEMVDLGSSDYQTVLATELTLSLIHIFIFKKLIGTVSIISSNKAHQFFIFRPFSKQKFSGAASSCNGGTVGKVYIVWAGYVNMKDVGGNIADFFFSI